MKWMLVVMVFNTTPVETGLMFNTLDDCYRAEDQMRAEYTKSYNNWVVWAHKHLSDADFQSGEKMQLHRLANGVCVPHA